MANGFNVSNLTGKMLERMFDPTAKAEEQLSLVAVESVQTQTKFTSVNEVSKFMRECKSQIAEHAGKDESMIRNEDIKDFLKDIKEVKDMIDQIF